MTLQVLDKIFPQTALLCTYLKKCCMKKVLKGVLRVVILLFILLNVIVIFHAYKFTHFYDAGDPSVKKQELKTGWDKTKDILFGFNTAKQKNIAPDSAFAEIKVMTTDGLQLSCWYMTVPEAKGTVLLFHGHGSKKSAVLNEAYRFQQLGYNTFLTDFRAHGSSEGNTSTIGYSEAEDVKAVYDYVAGKGEKNITIWGISMGAASVAKAISEYDLGAKRVILEMPFGSLPEAVVGKVKMMHLPPQPISTLLTFWGGTIHGFWAFNFKVTDYVEKIKCPVLMQWGAKDPRVTRAETDSVYAHISAPKKLVVYTESAHESLCTKEPAKWMKNVSAFMAE